MSDGQEAAKAATRQALDDDAASDDVILITLVQRREPPPPLASLRAIWRCRILPTVNCARYDNLQVTRAAA